MGKKAMVLILLVFFSLTVAFAETGTIQWRYKIRKIVEENIILSFTDNVGNTISSYSLDLDKDLSYGQVHLRVLTNKVNPYTLMLTFSTMTQAGDSGATFFGFYKARVSDILTYSSGDLSYRDIVFSSADDETVSFSGDVSNSASNTVSFYYPISFDFSDYIESYSAGTYSGTITVEVATE